MSYFGFRFCYERTKKPIFQNLMEVFQNNIRRV